MSTKEAPIERIPVVILAGGMGTRLREATESVPKPLVEIGEKPILWHIMKLYGHYGLKRFVLCLGYKSWQIKEYFLRYREHLSDVTVHIGKDHRTVFHNQPAEEDWEVTMAETGLLTGTGARLRFVRDYVDTDTFMFTYGDGIGEVDVAALLDFHRSHGKIGTVTGVHPTSRYGEMRVDGHAVAEFNEKPTTAAGFVSGGFFCCSGSSSTTSATTRLCSSSRRRCRPSPATASCACSPTRASGWGWTPTGSSASSTSCGPAARARWHVWQD